MTQKHESPSTSAQRARPVVSLDRRLLSIDEVAIVLNVSRSTVYTLIREKGLPFTKVGNMRRILLESLDWWIRQQECSTDPQMQAYLDSQRSPQTAVPIETMEKLTTRRKSR